MAGMQALHNFSYENGGTRVWRACDVGPGKFYSAVTLARFGTPQGPTELVTLEPFSRPHIKAGTYQQCAEPASATSEPGPLKELPFSSQTEHESEMFSCQEEGCIKTFKSFAALQKHLDVGKHRVLIVYVNMIISCHRVRFMIVMSVSPRIRRIVTSVRIDQMCKWVPFLSYLFDSHFTSTFLWQTLRFRR